MHPHTLSHNNHTKITVMEIGRSLGSKCKHGGKSFNQGGQAFTPRPVLVCGHAHTPCGPGEEAEHGGGGVRAEVENKEAEVRQETIFCLRLSSGPSIFLLLGLERYPVFTSFLLMSE